MHFLKSESDHFVPVYYTVPLGGVIFLLKLQTSFLYYIHTKNIPGIKVFYIGNHRVPPNQE